MPAYLMAPQWVTWRGLEYKAGRLGGGEGLALRPRGSLKPSPLIVIEDYPAKIIV